MCLTLADRHSHFSACAQQKFSLNGVTPSILPSVSLSLLSFHVRILKIFIKLQLGQCDGFWWLPILTGSRIISQSNLWGCLWGNVWTGLRWDDYPRLVHRLAIIANKKEKVNWTPAFSTSFLSVDTVWPATSHCRYTPSSQDGPKWALYSLSCFRQYRRKVVVM